MLSLKIVVAGPDLSVRGNFKHSTVRRLLRCCVPPKKMNSSLGASGRRLPRRPAYVFSLGTDLTDVAAGHGLEAYDTRGRDARDTIVRPRPRWPRHGGILHG